MKTIKQIRTSLPTYPIEVDFPSITKWRTSNTGVDYVHTFDSGLPGPHVMIMSLTHGNEVSGAIAVDLLLEAELRPLMGRITLAFGNVDAYNRFDRKDADATRFIDEDMNRVWSESRLESQAESLELLRARELRPIIDSVDFLLDIHSMHEEAEPVMMSGPLEKGIRFAGKVGIPEHVIVDSGHPNGKRLRDYGGFGDPGSLKNALLIETGQHFSRRSKEVALDSACRFLIVTGVIQADQVDLFLTRSKTIKQRFLKVTDAIVARTMDFEFMQAFRGLEIIDNAGTIIARDGDRDIATPYDQCIIVQPSRRHLGPDVTVMRLAKLLDI